MQQIIKNVATSQFIEIQEQVNSYHPVLFEAQYLNIFCRLNQQQYSGCFFLVVSDILISNFEQRERVFHRDIQTREKNGDVCFRVFGFHCLGYPLFSSVWKYPGETLARVVYMASQMNRDVTACFGLLI